jgi:hypothetical protein
MFFLRELGAGTFQGRGNGGVLVMPLERPTGRRKTMKTRITCPCGQVIRAETEDDMVKETEMHLLEVHGRTYTRDEILFMAM